MIYYTVLYGVWRIPLGWGWVVESPSLRHPSYSKKFEVPAKSYICMYIYICMYVCIYIYIYMYICNIC